AFHLLPARLVLLDVGERDDVHARVDDGRGRHAAVSDAVQQLDALFTPPEVLLTEQDVRLAFAQQVEGRLHGVERDDLRLRRVDRVERVAGEDGPAAHRDPGAEIGIAPRAGSNQLAGPDDVFL